VGCSRPAVGGHGDENRMLVDRVPVHQQLHVLRQGVLAAIDARLSSHRRLGVSEGGCESWPSLEPMGLLEAWDGPESRRASGAARQGLREGRWRLGFSHAATQKGIAKFESSFCGPYGGPQHAARPTNLLAESESWATAKACGLLRNGAMWQALILQGAGDTGLRMSPGGE
jgi:hypothetical protein